jgi:hypothetical protein
MPMAIMMLLQPTVRHPTQQAIPQLTRVQIQQL